MSYQNCIAAITKAAGRPLHHDEIEAIVEKIAARVERKIAAGETRLAAHEQAGQELAGEALLAAIIERRNAAINVRVRKALDGRIRLGQEIEGIREVLTGVQRTRRDAGRSIDAEAHAGRDAMMGGLLHDLRAAGVLDAVRERDANFDRAVAVELWRLADPDSAAATGNAHAGQVARILHKYQEAQRGEMNEAGAWIGKLDHYITRQSHDQFLVRGAGDSAAMQAWIDYIAPRLDERSFEGRPDRQKFLQQVWAALSSGLHESGSSEVLAGFKGPGNLAKRLSQDRVLHFKGPQDWWQYNERFGRGRVLDSVMRSLEFGQRDLALMRTLGTNPEAMFTAWREKLETDARDRGDVAAAAKIATAGDTVFAVVTGAADRVGNATGAKIGSAVRTMNQVTKLGGVVLSSIPDLAVNASMLRHNGIGLFESYGREMMSLLPTGAATREVAETLGVGIDHLTGSVMHRFQAEDGMPGMLAAAARKFHVLNGLTYWTDALKEASGLMLSHNLARRAAQGFDHLPERMQASLRRYGIEQAEWDAVRTQPTRAADGRDYILPADIADGELRRKVQTYILDQVREGMSEPTALGRTFSTGGLARGTWGGELIRTLAQFKQYTVTYLDRSLMRDLTRYAPDEVSGWRRLGYADVGGTAHLIAATWAFGYLAMTLKELAKGRSPREPHDAGDYAKLVMAAGVQGGGLGIFGDFLFGEASGTGGGWMETLAGPSASIVGDLERITKAIRDGDKPAANALQAAKNNTPFLNLFWSRLILDHLVLFRLQEWANPGYLRRYEARVRRENNQEFWLSPSAFVR